MTGLEVLGFLFVIALLGVLGYQQGRLGDRIRALEFREVNHAQTPPTGPNLRGSGNAPLARAQATARRRDRKAPAATTRYAKDQPQRARHSSALYGPPTASRPLNKPTPPSRACGASERARRKTPTAHEAPRGEIRFAGS